MEVLVSNQGQKHNQQAYTRKCKGSVQNKDLWFAVREGSSADVDLALSVIKKNGGNVNARNAFGLTPLHIATWRNHIPIIRRLLDAGADPDARDGESGWSSLHRAMHFGHLAVASILIQSGASLALEDSKSRTPIDLLSGPVVQAVQSVKDSAVTAVFSWGNGANYQLGTGKADLQKLPLKVDSLHGSFIKLVSAAKFHSIAVSARGEVYSWGFGRGGRLGYPDFDIHSGQAAVITPRQVTSGLGFHRVKAIAAAKHHTVVATEGGEVFTWGSNREGQLGYTSVDNQPTPRRVSSLRSRIIAVAAANKHTAVVSEYGEVFTWGCNREGQLGYGTSNSASNYTPRVVECLKGKVSLGVAAAKYNTVVYGADGEVFTWGHRLVTPRRVLIVRNLKKSGSTPMKFHRMERVNVVAVVAGMVHSTAITDDGSLFYWVSSDSDLKCQQLYSLCGKKMVSISAGKYWTAAVSDTGDVYMWDGKNSREKVPTVTRLPGVKKATSISVGETHLLIISSLYHPPLPSSKAQTLQNLKVKEEEFEEYELYNDPEPCSKASPLQDFSEDRSVPSLLSLCEKVAADSLVEPRNAVQLLEIADSLEAGHLRKYCEDIAIHNLDYILTVASQAFASASIDILASLEKLLDSRSSEPWSYRHLPTPTATYPVIIDSEEDTETEVIRKRDSCLKGSVLKNEVDRLGSFLQCMDESNQGMNKLVRALRKKLQQIEMLEARVSSGCGLDDQQIAKLKTRSNLESSLAKLGVPVDPLPSIPSQSSMTPPDVKSNIKAEVSRKQRRKGKRNVAQNENEMGSSFPGNKEDSTGVMDFLADQISQASSNKDENGENGANEVQDPKESTFTDEKKENVELVKNKNSHASASKKKNRRGGLSMFLSGALDDAPKPKLATLATPILPTPQSEGPAWGGVKVSKGYASLREIQDEQIKIQGNGKSGSKNQVEDHFDHRSEGKFLLSSLLPSIPIPVVQAPKASDGEKSTPPWASGTPPHLSRPSLRDIQIQQGKQLQVLSQSPKMSTTGFSIGNSPVSPSDSPGMNRWFKPEVESPSSIRSIQIEERAMKDLKRFYSSVKVVKNQS